jgi:hypothetical protein
MMIKNRIFTALTLVVLFSSSFPRWVNGDESALLKSVQVALDAYSKSNQVLSLSAENKTFLDGKLDIEATTQVAVGMNGGENLVVVDYDPLIKFGEKASTQARYQGVFNGRYWTYATYEIGNPGKDNFVPLNELRITANVHPMFSNYKRRTGLELLAPFFRFQITDGFISLRDVVLGRSRYTVSVSQVEKAGKNLIKINLGGDSEWVLLDPQRGFIVIEHVIQEKNWSQETIANEIEQAACGVWYAKEYVHKRIRNGSEVYRSETKIGDVKFLSAESFDLMLKPKFGSGWKIIDERIGKEFTIGDDPGVMINTINTQLK